MVSRDSGAVWPLTSAPSGIGDFLPTFSPDGNRVAFMRDGGYFTLRIAASGPEGEPQPVPVPGGLQELSNAVWSPEGGELYFFAESLEGRRGIWATPITEATEPRFLSAAPGYAYYDLAVARSPSGGLRFAYKAEVRDGDIMRVSLTAPSTPEPLITSTKDEFSPQFSPDGSKVAYVSDRSGTKDLYYFNLQSGNHTALTKGAIQPNAYPVPMWSPDGRHILYSRGFGISIVDVRTHRTLTLAQHGRWPCWSRDGQWVYFISEKSGNNALWRVSFDASTEEQMGVFPSSRLMASLDPTRMGLYFILDASLMLLPLDEEGRPTGPAKPIAEGVAGWDAFSVVDRGVYFLDDSGWVRFYDSKVGQSHPVYQIREPLHWELAGPPVRRGQISISRDENWLLYTRGTRKETDLMLLTLAERRERTR